MESRYSPRLALAACVGSLGLLSVPAVAVPPPPNAGAATTDCAAPVYAIDRLICDDPELSHLNAALAARIARPSAADTALKPGHAEWYRSSRMCAAQPDAKACILKAYLKRLQRLGPISEHPSPSGEVR